jgi:hypothetical protein
MRGGRSWLPAAPHTFRKARFFLNAFRGQAGRILGKGVRPATTLFRKLKMKIASIIAAVIVAAAAFYFNQPNRPPCDDNILASNIVGCDISSKGSAQ